MDDYNIILSYSLNNAVREFFGDLCFGCCYGGTTLSGKVYGKENHNIDGELWGILNHGTLNLLKKPLNDESAPVRQFQVFRENGGEDLILGKYGGGWKERWDISHNSDFSNFLWLNSTLSGGIWRNPAKNVSIEILPSQKRDSDNLNTARTS